MTTMKANAHGNVVTKIKINIAYPQTTLLIYFMYYMKNWRPIMSAVYCYEKKNSHGKINKIQYSRYGK